MNTAVDLEPVLKNARELGDWIAHLQDGLEIKTHNLLDDEKKDLSVW